jgi:hypothetical protein
MTRKRLVSWTAAAAGIVLAATCGVAAAHGMHGRGGRGCGPMWLLARSAGLSNTQIRTAFHSNPNLKTDFSNLRSTREAMATCIVKGATCTKEISAFANAKQKLITDKMGVWQKLFQSPKANTKQATAVLGQLRHLRDQRHKIFKQIFASNKKSASAPTTQQ